MHFWANVIPEVVEVALIQYYAKVAMDFYAHKKFVHEKWLVLSKIL